MINFYLVLVSLFSIVILIYFISSKQQVTYTATCYHVPDIFMILSIISNSGKECFKDKGFSSLFLHFIMTDDNVYDDQMSSSYFIPVVLPYCQLIDRDKPVFEKFCDPVMNVPLGK